MRWRRRGVVAGSLKPRSWFPFHIALRCGSSSSRSPFVASDLAPFLAPKGSVTIDGVSLTVNEVRDESDSEGGGTHFAINLIPHTQAVTTLGGLAEGHAVNVEIDVLARYLQRMEHYRGRH